MKGKAFIPNEFYTLYKIRYNKQKWKYTKRKQKQ